MRGTANTIAMSIFGAVILAIYALYLLWLAAEGGLTRFVHPRYGIFIAVSAVSALIMAAVLVYAARESFSSALKARHVIVLLIPLVLAFASRNLDDDFSSSMSAESTAEDFTIDFSGVGKSVPRFIETARKSSLIVLDDVHFAPMVDDLYANPGKYRGKTVVMKGLVLKRKHAPRKDEFALARMLMVCCVADLQPMGLVCRYVAADTVREKSWYRIKGVIETETTDEGVIPLLRVESVEKIEKPQREYVYPY